MSNALQLATEIIHGLKSYGNVVLLSPELVDMITEFKELVQRPTVQEVSSD